MQNDTTIEVRDRLELDRFLPYKLSVLSNRISDAIARQYSERFALSIPEWRVMAALGNTPWLSASEVAQRTAMDKVQVSRAVASLVETERVERMPDAEDGRIVRLALSRDGQAVYRQIVPLALELEETLLAALSPEERRALDTLLQKLSRQVSALVDSAADYRPSP